jgi:PPK2 family polyphosphate:nucleotide phosphotransferase
MSKDKLANYKVTPGKKVSLKRDFKTTPPISKVTKEVAIKKMKADLEKLSELQDKLYAQNRYSVLCIFQAMDAAGKDGTIKHVMSGINPQGCEVTSFKVPSFEELDHDYLWRYSKRAPERGRIGIFNRSYYEEVLVVRVHPNVLANEHLPDELKDKGIWQRRFDEINNYEQFLTNNGTKVLKFFLHVSKEEQKHRFLERIAQPEKNWKFSLGDLVVRESWDDYMEAYEAMLAKTSTKSAPWYVIPADDKWYCRYLVSTILTSTLSDLKLSYPQITNEHKAELLEAKKRLLKEKS